MNYTPIAAILPILVTCLTSLYLVEDCCDVYMNKIDFFFLKIFQIFSWNWQDYEQLFWIFKFPDFSRVSLTKTAKTDADFFRRLYTPSQILKESYSILE